MQELQPNQEQRVRCEQCGDDPRKEVRSKTFADGRPQFCYQCIDCGKLIGKWLAKGSPAVLQLTERIPFDEAALEAYNERRNAMYQDRFFAKHREYQQAAETADAQRKQEYNDYLKTPAWRNRRELVLKRANNICEGCGKNRATEVHHMTYDHIRNEFLWELVAICRPCHERFHDKAGNE